MNRHCTLLLCAFALSAVSLPAADNRLSAAEATAGWHLLFDGKSFAGWRGYRATAVPANAWQIKDGAMGTLAGVKDPGIITEKTFGDFELTWEWRIGKGGNNGVKYFVTEERPGAPGHEYQMIDDANSPDGKFAKRQTAAFYDVLPSAADRPLRPAGEWNTSRLVVRGDRVEHWLNGRNVLTYMLGSPELHAALAQSKFKNYSDFGVKRAGHIMLTYHGGGCSFRNVKIRELRQSGR